MYKIIFTEDKYVVLKAMMPNVNMIEEGIDKFIKHDKTEESRDYVVLKVYLKPE